MIDVRRLAGWMNDQGLPGQGEPVEHRFVSGGTQNEIYEISRTGPSSRLAAGKSPMTRCARPKR